MSTTLMSGTKKQASPRYAVTSLNMSIHKTKEYAMEYITDFSIFPFQLGVFNDKEKMQEESKRLCEISPSMGEGCAGYVHSVRHKITHNFVVFVYIDTTFEDYSPTVVHEAVHVKQHVMSFLGEDNIGEETEAYFIGAIYRTVMKELDRLSKEDEAVNDCLTAETTPTD